MDFYQAPSANSEFVERLNLSEAAIELYLDSEIIDPHLEPFIWSRIFGYDLSRYHSSGWLQGRFFSQTDFPRLLESNFAGGVFSISTNPFRRRGNRAGKLLENLNALTAKIRSESRHLALVDSYTSYVDARAQGKMACWVAIQGGNALDSHGFDFSKIPDNCISRITLVHLSTSTLGETSAPSIKGLGFGANSSLTTFGKQYVEELNDKRILVDLAHISAQGFWDAIDVHDKSLPVVVTHTGVRGVHDHWRNLDDDQIRAIADSGGVIGIIFHGGYLGGDILNGGIAARVVDHMAHVISLVGDDYVCLGSDWDGFIIPPKDMRTVSELPILVQIMLDRGWSDERVKKIMGGNYLRVISQIRP